MKIEEFIAQWAPIKVEDPTVIIRTTEEVTPAFKIITDGSATNIEVDHCYSWSCTDRCLYCKGELVCCKTHGIYLCNEKYISYLEEFSKNNDIVFYVFTRDILSYETLISSALHKFYECATEEQWIDPVITQLVQTLNISYENKYLEYCRKLPIDKFKEVTSKHAQRLQNKTKSRRNFNGLWYLS